LSAELAQLSKKAWWDGDYHIVNGVSYRQFFDVEQFISAAVLYRADLMGESYMPLNGTGDKRIRQQRLRNAGSEFIRANNQDIEPNFAARSITGPNPGKHDLREQSE
jgi:hypothetical protein